jgi:hypothetical protein
MSHNSRRSAGPGLSCVRCGAARVPMLADFGADVIRIAAGAPAGRSAVAVAPAANLGEQTGVILRKTGRDEHVIRASRACGAS